MQLEPVTENDDFRAAMICTTIANSNRQRGQRKAKIKDFMPKRIAAAKQSTADQIATFRSLTED